MYNLSLISNIFVYIVLLFLLILKAGEDDSLLDINRKMARRVFFLHASLRLRFNSHIPISFTLSFPFYSQIGLNVTQICLVKECSEIEVS